MLALLRLLAVPLASCGVALASCGEGLAVALPGALLGESNPVVPLLGVAARVGKLLSVADAAVPDTEVHGEAERDGEREAESRLLREAVAHRDCVSVVQGVAEVGGETVGEAETEAQGRELAVRMI